MQTSDVESTHKLIGNFQRAWFTGPSHCALGLITRCGPPDQLIGYTYVLRLAASTLGDKLTTCGFCGTCCDPAAVDLALDYDLALSYRIVGLVHHKDAPPPKQFQTTWLVGQSQWIVITAQTLSCEHCVHASPVFFHGLRPAKQVQTSCWVDGPIAHIQICMCSCSWRSCRDHDNSIGYGQA